jgi:hypothetical protein
VVLRLIEPWFATERVIIGDSAFSSVKTAEALLQQGLHYMGVVKTAYKRYPMKQFREWNETPGLPRGSHRVLKSEVDGRDGTKKPIFALAWKDVKTKYFIMTRGTTISGPPHKRLKRRKVLTDGHYSIETEVVPIERPLAVYELYKYFSNVDIHDHLRQGSLMLETHWRTKIWWHRLFSSILGMIFTDTYLAHQWDLANGWDADTYDKEPLTNYMRRLSYQLIHFNDPTPIITRSATIAEEVGPKVSGIHLIIQFSFCMKYV